MCFNQNLLIDHVDSNNTEVFYEYLSDLRVPKVLLLRCLDRLKLGLEVSVLLTLTDVHLKCWKILVEDAVVFCGMKYSSQHFSTPRINIWWWSPLIQNADWAAAVTRLPNSNWMDASLYWLDGFIFFQFLEIIWKWINLKIAFDQSFCVGSLMSFPIPQSLCYVCMWIVNATK